MTEARQKSPSTMGLLALAAILVLLAVPALASGQAPAAVPMPHQAHFDMHLQKMAQKLNLTAEQQAAAKQLAQDLQTKLAPLHQAQQALHTQLEAALAAPNPDAAAVGQLVIQIHQGHAQLKPAMDAFHQQLEALLNPDQLAQYKQMLADHPAFGHHRGMGSDLSQ